MPSLAGFFICAFCAIVMVCVVRGALVSTKQLEEDVRLDELLPRLLPYSYRGDRDRLQAAIGGVAGLRAMRRAGEECAQEDQWSYWNGFVG